MIKTRILLGSLALLFASDLCAQQAAYVSVTSNLEEVAVYADTLYLGSADGQYRALNAGTYTFTALRVEDIASWDSPKPSKTLKLTGGDSLSIELTFPNIYHFNSFPMGATVLDSDGAKLGITPFRYSSNEELVGRLTFMKSGYLDYSLEKYDDSEINAIMSLVDPDLDGNQEAFKRKPQPVRGKLVTATIVAGTAIAAGLSIHYKFKADRLYDEYVDITDPELRPEILRNDRYAGAALGVMQGGLVLLAVRLAF